MKLSRQNKKEKKNIDIYIITHGLSGLPYYSNILLKVEQYFKSEVKLFSGPPGQSYEK